MPAPSLVLTIYIVVALAASLTSAVESPLSLSLPNELLGMFTPQSVRTPSLVRLRFPAHSPNLRTDLVGDEVGSLVI